ncbi:MAG: hypothetical protein WBL61_20960 [Bryobacteraceae bacterium]
MLAHLSRHRSIASIGLVLAVVTGFEAKAQMSAPLVGLIAGGSTSPSEIRPVLGVLGAASIQAPVLLSREVSKIYLAPAGGWALVERRGGAPGLVTFKGSVPGAIQAIADATPNPALVSFSTLGKAAALATSGAIQVLTGLDAKPQVAFQVSFSDPSGVKKIALSDDGRLLAVLTAAGQVYVLSGSISPRLAYTGSASLGIAFLPGQSTAVIADSGSGMIELASIVNGAPSVRTVAAGMSFSAGETLVEASGDGASAFVVESGGTSAFRVELATGSTQTMTLPTAATRLDRLRDGESFVFSAEPGRSAWFLTGRDAGLQAVFAAAAATTEVSRQ